MGCYLEDCRATVRAWDGRFWWLGVPRRGEADRTTGSRLGFTVLISIVLAVLLMIGGTEHSPGPVVEVENTVQLLCTELSRNLKLGIQCELCGRWYQYNCGSVKAQAAEREKWNCDKCRTKKVRRLQEDLQKALRQINELKVRNRKLVEKLLQAGAGKMYTVPAKQRTAKCMLVSDSLLRSAGAEHANMMVECFPGIKTEQLHRETEDRYLRSPETAIIHVGTNDLITTRNLYFVMGEVYALVVTAKRKLPNCRLSCVECCDVETCHGGVLGHLTF